MFFHNFQNSLYFNWDVSATIIIDTIKLTFLTCHMPHHLEEMEDGRWWEGWQWGHWKPMKLLFWSVSWRGLRWSTSPGPFCKIHHCIYFKCFPENNNNLKIYIHIRNQDNFHWGTSFPEKENFPFGKLWKIDSLLLLLFFTWVCCNLFRIWFIN